MAAQVDLIIGQTGAVVAPSRTNSALDLAASLASVTPQTTALFSGIQQKAREEAATAAKRDALANSGMAYAEAIRAGKIKPVSSPWYIQQYEQQAAQVRAQGIVAQIANDSQTWEEKNDPAAFNARLSRELGVAAKSFQGTDAQLGFQAAASPILQQETARNVAYNSSRIVQEHETDAGTIATKTLIDVNKANGGKATPEQLFGALEEQRAAWIATGGTDDSFDRLTINAVRAAAYQTEDPALLDALSDERAGLGALGNIVGPDGQPIAASIASDQYRIEQASVFRSTAEVRKKKAETELAGTEAYEKVLDKFGYEFLNGKVSGKEIKDFLEAEGVDPSAASYALGLASNAASDSNTLNRALYSANGEKILTLYARARSNGWTKDLQEDVFEMVRTDAMPFDEGEQLLGAAFSKSDSIEAEQRAAGRAAASEARADARQARAEQLQDARDMKLAREQNVADLANLQASQGIKTWLDPRTRRMVMQRAQDAEGAYLKAHPGDKAGAIAAAEEALIEEDRKVRARRKPAQPSAAAKKDKR